MSFSRAQADPLEQVLFKGRSLSESSAKYRLTLICLPCPALSALDASLCQSRLSLFSFVQ